MINRPISLGPWSTTTRTIKQRAQRELFRRRAVALKIQVADRPRGGIEACNEHLLQKSNPRIVRKLVQMRSHEFRGNRSPYKHYIQELSLKGTMQKEDWVRYTLVWSSSWAQHMTVSNSQQCEPCHNATHERQVLEIANSWPEDHDFTICGEREVSTSILVSWKLGWMTYRRRWAGRYSSTDLGLNISRFDRTWIAIRK